MREFRGASAPASLPSAARNTSVEELSKILSASQLSPANRSFYLSLRAFVFSRMGREADSQKDVAEMGRINPQGWPVMMWMTIPTLAGGGDRGAALRSLGYALERKPNDPWLLIAQAQVQMQIADFAQRAGTLDSAVAGAASPGRSGATPTISAAMPISTSATTQQAAGDFDAALEGQTTLKGRIGVVLWRYAAQVRGRQDARAVLIQATSATRTSTNGPVRSPSS